jgi:hypothetical protein
MLNYHERRGFRVKTLHVFSHVGQNSGGFLIVGVTETIGLMFHMLRSVREEPEY